MSNITPKVINVYEKLGKDGCVAVLNTGEEMEISCTEWNDPFFWNDYKGGYRLFEGPSGMALFLEYMAAR